MRSATSYFNGTLYRKTLARFWPLWGLWGVGWLFLLPLNLLARYFEVSSWRSNDPAQALFSMAKDLPNILSAGLLLAVAFAILCAMAVFGYLYNSRSACWTHALPVRREALFTTQYLAGLSFLLLPLLAVGVLTAIVEMSFLPISSWGAALSALLAWLLAQGGMCLFFFSFAAFCAMFTGHILALPAFYFILNFLVSGLWYLLSNLMREFYFGYTASPGIETAAEWLTPIAALLPAVTWDDEGMVLRSPGTVAVYALVGLVLFLAALYVYRRRHVETAGDVVAVALVRPLFKYGVSFCAGLFFGIYTYAFFGWGTAPLLVTCILFWAVIGCFAAEMLLKKSFRVLSAWKGAAAVAGVLLAICVVCFLDLFNIVGRVPAVDQVNSVELNLWLGSPYDDGRRLEVTLTDPEHIAMVTALHQAVVDNRDTDLDYYYDDYTNVKLSYTLSNGRQLNRDYQVVPINEADLEVPGTAAYAFQAFLEDRELVRKAYGFDTFLEDARLTTAWLTSLEVTSGSDSVYVDDYAQELWDAVLADFDEGTIGLRYPFDNGKDRKENTYITDLVFGATRNQVAGRPGFEYTSSHYSNDELRVTLTPNARHTLAVLDKTGLWEEGYALHSWENEDASYEPYTENRSEIVY